MILLTGTLLVHGRRTVAAAQRHAGNERESNFRTFHQVLNRVRWSPLAVSRQLLTIIVETFVQAGGTLELVIDETLERRWGPKIGKRGHFRDSMLSSRKRSVSSPGLRWMVMSVVVMLGSVRTQSVETHRGNRRILRGICLLLGHRFGRRVLVDPDELRSWLFQRRERTN